MVLCIRQKAPHCHLLETASSGEQDGPCQQDAKFLSLTMLSQRLTFWTEIDEIIT